MFDVRLLMRGRVCVAGVRAGRWGTFAILRRSRNAFFRSKTPGARRGAIDSYCLLGIDLRVLTAGGGQQVLPTELIACTQNTRPAASLHQALSQPGVRGSGEPELADLSRARQSLALPRRLAKSSRDRTQFYAIRWPIFYRNPTGAGQRIWARSRSVGLARSGAWRNGVPAPVG